MGTQYLSYPRETDPYWANVLLRQTFEGGVSTDYSTYNRTGGGTTPRATPVNTDAKYGTYCLENIGTDNALQMTDATVTLAAEFTIECWAKFDVISGTQQIIGQYRRQAVGNKSVELFVNSSGQLRLELRNDFSSTLDVLTGNTVMTTGVWYHVAATRDASSDIRLFVGGVVQSSTLNDTTSLFGDLARFTLTSSVGAGPAFSSKLNGKIDDTRITAACRYTGTFTPPTAQMPLS